MAIYSISSIEEMFPLARLQAIADKIGQLIQRNIVLYGKSGTIIAATNTSRIGIHGTKIKEMIDSDREMHIIYGVPDEDGLRPGVSLPIKYDNINIGGLGITGDPDDVITFCRVVREFLQQQLVDLEREKNTADQRQLLSNFIYSWIYTDIRKDNDEFRNRAASLGIDINKPHIICVMNSSLDVTEDQLRRQILAYTSDRLNSIFGEYLTAQLGNDTLLLMESSDTPFVTILMQELQKSIQRHFHVTPAIGIGSTAENAEDVRLSYTAAKLACETSMKSSEHKVIQFELYDIGILLSTADEALKQRIYNYIFRNYTSDRQIEESIEIINNYVIYNRSITDIAIVMNLHKNTVQFRLNKILELTGYNPRETRDLAFLYTVVLMHEMGIRKTGR